MENYEQHNEVSTSYNNLKHYNDCKEFYLETEKKDPYRFKMEETSQSTPFSVKDILNPTCHYERSDFWKYNDRDKRTYEFDPMYQTQGYCPEYFGQVYPNIPVHNNIDYWTPETYHDHKLEDYYSYNPYCHNLYQNFEYAEVPAYQGMEVKIEDVEKETINVETSSPVAVETVPEFVAPVMIPKDLPKKTISK